MISEDRSYTATIPEFPVEDGFSVSDTIILQPLERSFTLLIAAAPATFYYRHGSDRSRVEQICNQLEELWLDKKLVKIVTPTDILTSMGITSLVIKRTTELGYSREVDISVKKVFVTEKQTVSIPASVPQSGATAAQAGKAKTSTSSKSATQSGGTAASSGGSASAESTRQKSESTKGASKATGTTRRSAAKTVLSWLKGG